MTDLTSDPNGPGNALIGLAADASSIIDIIGRTDYPAGARQITNDLRQRGFALSESTVARHLRRLDQKGLTRPVGAKGRTLTELGRRQWQGLQSLLRREASGYLDINTIHDVLNLLLARRAVEREAARAAAIRIEPEELDELRRLIGIHSQVIPNPMPTREVARDFHLKIARASGNKVVIAMADLAFDPQLDQTEAILDAIIGSHHNERQSIAEHQRIVDAIADRNPTRAEHSMTAHMSRLIDEVEVFMKSDGVKLVDRVISLMRAQ